MKKHTSIYKVLSYFFHLLLPFKAYKVSYEISCGAQRMETLAPHSKYLYKSVNVIALTKKKAMEKANKKVLDSIKVSHLKTRVM